MKPTAPTVRFVLMTEGGSHTIPPWARNVVFVSPSDLAAFTVVMPDAPIDGEIRTITFDKAVSSLTVTSTLAVNLPPPTSAAAGDRFSWSFSRAARSWYAMAAPAAPGGSGVTDHGALTGRGDDDHTQYHTDARGDARYSPIGHSHSYEAAGAVAAHAAAVDPHPGYLTPAEGAAAFSALGHSHDYAATGHTHVGVYQPLATVLTNTTAAFTAAQETKLAGIDAAATANASDAALRDRGTHTGTQAAATISDFTEAAQDVVGAMVAAAGGSYNDIGNTITLPAGGGSDPWTWTKLASDSTVSTVAYAAVAGLSFSALANTTYLVQMFGAFTTAATTTGIGIALTVPAGALLIGGIVVNSTTTATQGLIQRATAAVVAVSTGVAAINVTNPLSAFWIVAIGATPGTVQVTQRSEVAASNTVLTAGITALGRRVI